jgi:hypothetical protein
MEAIWSSETSVEFQQTQKTVLFITTGVRTSDPSYAVFVSRAVVSEEQTDIRSCRGELQGKTLFCYRSLHCVTRLYIQ